MCNVMHRNMKSVESEKQLLCAIFLSSTFFLVNKNKSKILSVLWKRKCLGYLLI